MTIRPAGRLRRFVHRHMLRYDEHVCRSLTYPPHYELPDDKIGMQLRDLFERLASGRVQAFYDNGLQVPRSLFHSRIAGLSLSRKARTRMLVITPYFFFSGRELLLSEGELKGPWGGLSRD